MKLSHIHCLWVLLMAKVVTLNICRVTALAFHNNVFVIFKIISISRLLLTVGSSKTAIILLNFILYCSF